MIMTVEEKAKAYDEAIERAKAFNNGEDVNIEAGTTLCEYIFPELKGSEDERIRKEIIEMLRNWASVHYITKEQFRERMTWLEKQEFEPNWCHHKVDLSNCSEEYRKAYYDGWNNCNMQHSQRKSDGNDVVRCLINGMKFYYEGNEEATWGTKKFSMKVKNILSWLEKQGEPNPYSGVSFKYNGHTWGMCARDNGVEILIDGEIKERVFLDNKPQGKSALEAILEEKVEPKFKIGDIVQYITDSTDRRKIEEIDTLCNMYHTDSSPIMFEIENEWKVV